MTRADLPDTPAPLLTARTTWAALLLILVLAGSLRLSGLAAFPPGLHQDEATNAWNAWCLLHTGTDQFGTPWPIFCLRAIGDYRSTPYTYAVLACQAFGGLNHLTMRLPAAVGGLLTIALLYWVGARLFGRGTGLAAAALLALNPTHIQMTRLGLEASHTPLLTLLPVAAWLWAGFPLARAQRPPRVGRSLIAGLLTGAACYGYPAARLFIPLLMTGVVAATLPGWWCWVRQRRAFASIAALLLGIVATFGPLAYQHLTQPETIGKRGGTTWVWYPDDPLATRFARVAQRYGVHFLPDFLLLNGDADETFWTVGYGFLPTYAAPLLGAGLIIIVPRLRRSPPARVLLIGVLLYPAADALNWHVSLHALRSSAGLWILVLLAGVGTASVLGWLYRRQMRAGLVACAVALAAMIVPYTTGFLLSYFRDRPSQIPVYYGTHQDLLAACDWLAPRVDDVDVVACFAAGPNPGYTPYLMPLIRLRHDPARWFAEPRDIRDLGAWDRCVRYGKFHFLYLEERLALLDSLRPDNVSQRVVVIQRPQDPAPCAPAYQIREPGGEVCLVIYDCRL